MKIGRLNRASFAKTARRAMFLFAFAALGAQAAMVAKVGETAYETLDEAIKAVRDGETIVVNAGEYKLNGNLTYTGKTFTIQAAEGATVSFDMSAAVALHGAKITFSGVTFNYKTNKDYTGLQHADTLVYNDCTVNGKVFLYAASETFNRCTFTQTAVDYNVWTYGAKAVTFNGCTFNCVGKSVLVYNEGSIPKTELAVSDCEFKASAPVEGKAAIEIDTSLMAGGVTITVDAKTTAEGFAEGSNSKNTLWNDKKQKQDTNKNTTVTVAGETVFTPIVAQVGEKTYTTLAAALADVAEGKPLTWVAEGSWPVKTPVYYNGTFYETGTGFAAKGALERAIDAANAEGAAAVAKIYVRPGFEADELVLQAHQQLKTGLAIYGNDAKLSRNWAPCVEYPGTSGDSGAHQLTKDVSLAIYNLHNGAGFWGRRTTAYTVDLKLSGCRNAYQVMFYGNADTGVKGKTNISVTNCTFDATTKADHNVLVTIGAGTVDVSDTTFTAANINVKNVDGGDNVITVNNCTFKDTVAGNQNIRVRSYVEGTHADLTIENVTFAGDSTQNVEIGDSKAECKGVVNYTITKTSGTMNVYKQGVTTAEATTFDAAVAYSGDNVGTIADEKALRRAFFAAPTDGTAVTVTLGADITLETLYAAENFGTEKLDDNAEGDTFNRYKVGVHPMEEDPNHWNPLVTGQTQEQRLVYGAYYHMSATDERIARLVVKAGQKIVLDLNGHTIQKNARATHGDWSTVCTDIIGNYGTLEIKDSSTGTKGTIKGIGYISCQGAVLHNYAGATMTVTGVNVDGNAAGMEKGTGQYVVSNEGGTLTLDGVNVHDTATSASLIMSNGGTVTIKNATLSHPATKVINAKGGVINIESASVTSEKYAVFVTGDARVNVNGSLTIEGTGTLCVEGDAAALTKKPGVELSAPAGFTWVENDGVQVLKSFVAKVGETAYVTIAEAFAALSAENHTLTLLNENAWDATTPVYWAAGTQSGYAATLTAALTAAYKANVGAITVVCRPGADVGEMTHGHVADDLTIYGNDAYLSGGECDLEVDTYTFSRATGKQAADGVCLDKDITITAYELDNLGVWGQRHTAHKVTVNLTDCDGKALEGKTNLQRVYISGTTGVNDITLTDCDFLTKATAVYSNADGAIKAVNCSFTDGQVPFNINHKANGTQTVALTGCRFTNCGDAGGWKQFAAPLRLVNSGTGTQSAEVTGCAFAGTVGANGDILLGDGRTGQASNDVELKVVNTAANIQAQKPGYYGGETVDATKMATATSPADGTLETSVAKLLPVDPRTLGYATSGKAEALPAAPDMSGEVVNVTAAQAQYVLDGAYGPIDGKTINFTESINDTLILGRASKYDGSGTVYRHGSHDGEALSYADFIAYKNQSGWTESCFYERMVENVTFTANEGVTVKNFEADGGAHIYAGTAPVYDYVRDTGSWVTEGSCYFKRAILKNITFKGLTFKAKTDINTSESTTVYDGFTFKDCTFDLGTTADGNQAIRYYNENNNGNVKNLVVEGCTFKTCSQGVYTAHVKNVTVTGSTFDTTGHNAIAIQDFKGACDHGEVVITGNTFKDIGDRIIRFNNVGLGTTVTIKDNTADGNSGKLDEATGKREIVKATTLPVNAADSIKASGNNWGANTVVEGVFIDDYATKLGTEACPYSREQFAAMTRAEYIAAQKRLGGTLYVNVGNYAYEKNGVLGNGVRNDTTGQVPDHSKLNAYGENGYLGEKNDDANGHAVVFVGGTITSGVTGYTSIDSIGTSLLLAVPAYTKVTFKGTAFKNVLSFDYQLYTSPWSQLGGLTFKDCTFDGIIVGAIAAQELAFNGCTFNNYVNTTSANNSNPTWIRPAYGNWTKGDNEGQGTDFRSLTKITFENNTVTSTRPVKFERIAQWEMATTVTATGNTFAITPQAGDTSPKNVGLYFGANAKFDLVIDNNAKSDETAALYTAVYSAPNGRTYAGLPAGSTVKNAAGEAVATGDGDALAWKTTDKITLKTTEEVASVTNAKGVANFATLADAIAAAKDGETVTLLDDTVVSNVALDKSLTLDFNGKTVSSESGAKVLTVTAGTITIKNGTIQAGTMVNVNSGSRYSGPAIYVTVGQSATEKEIALTLENMTVLGIENQKRGVTAETMEDLVAGGMCKHEVKAGTAVEIYSKFDTAITVNVKNSTIRGGKGAATEGTVTEYLSGGANQADGGVGIYARGENLTLNIMEGSKVFGGDSDNKNAGVALDLQKCASVVISDSTVQGGNGYGIAGSAVYSSSLVTAVTVENSTLKGGDAQTSWNGAGIELTSESPTIIIKDSTVIGGQGPGNAKDPKGYAIDSNSATTTDKITLEGDVTLKANDKATVVRKTALGDPGFTLKDATVTIAGGALENVTVAVAEGSSQAKIRTSGETATVDVKTVVSSDDTKTLSDNGNGTFTFEACIARVTAADGSSSRGYLTLASALAAAKDGETVKLLADVTVAEQLVVEKPLTLDLGGKTVTSTYANRGYAFLTRAAVTVKNGTFAAGQARALSAYANLTLEDATITSELAGGNCCVAFSAANCVYTVVNTKIVGAYAIANFAHNATIAITGSALEGSGCGLYHNGSNYGLKLTVSDTTINGAIDQAIGEGKDPSGVYLSGSSAAIANAANQNGAHGRHQATFTRCTIKGNTGVEVKYTDLTLEDCTVVATTKEPSYTQNNNGMAALGFAVVSTDNATGNATPKPEGTITITGADGSYTGLVGLGSLDSVKTGFADFEDAHYAVSGGTFSDAVLPEYCAAGFIPTANDDGTYGVKAGAYVAAIGTTGYETLEAALAAADAGATVKMLADVVLTEKQTIAKALVLDLNGKTISSTVDQFITIVKGGDLTVNDTTGEGCIKNTVTESWGGTIKMTGGVLTVNGGTIAANSATSEYSPTIEADTSSSATINVVGGRIEADRTGNARAINLRTQANVTLNVTGGEIVGSQNGIYSFAGNTINISAGVVAGKAGSAVYSSGKNRVLISGGTLTPGGTASALYISMGSSATVTIGREGGKVDDVTIPSIDVGGCTTTVTLLSGTVGAFKNWGSMTVEKVSQGKDTLLVGTDITACLPGSDLLCQLDAASGLYEIVKLTVENAAAIVTHDDVETPYHTVEQACKAVTDGDTLTLKVDHTGSQTLSFSAKNVTVDLGGKTLTYTGATGGLSSALSFNQSTASDNTVTVKNGTIVANAQDATCVRAEMTGDLSKTLTVVFGENLTLTSGNTSRYGGVVFGTGARTASPCEKMTKGGLLVTEGEKVWIYGETATAFTHAKGSEVTLLNDWYDTDTKGTVKVPSSGTFASAKLNLNGHTIRSYGVNPAVLMGMVGENEDTAAKTLEISSGTIKTSRHGAAVCGSNKTLTLDGVTLTTTGDKMYGLYANGTTSGNTVTLKNKSAVLSEKATGIYFPGAGTLTVEDSNVTGGVSGIEVRAGVLNVSGTSVIESTATAFDFTNNDNGITTTGAAVAAVKHTVGNDLAVTITGGTFKGPRGFYANDPNVAKPGTVTVSISGGAFSTDVEKKYLADGCKTVQQTIDGTLYYVVGPAITQIGVTLGGVKKEMPFPDAWLADNIGADASSWTTEALEEKAKNELAKWQCYLFGLDPNKKEAKVVATAGQGTDKAIPLAVANADASASPLVKDGYVTVAYVLMGSNDGTAWTQVATSNKRDGLVIPLTGTTYKFYRVDVTVTSAEGN